MSDCHGSKISGLHQTENVTEKVNSHSCFKLHDLIQFHLKWPESICKRIGLMFFNRVFQQERLNRFP